MIAGKILNKLFETLFVMKRVASYCKRCYNGRTFPLYRKKSSKRCKSSLLYKKRRVLRAKDYNGIRHSWSSSTLSTIHLVSIPSLSQHSNQNFFCCRIEFRIIECYHQYYIAGIFCCNSFVLAKGKKARIVITAQSIQTTNRKKPCCIFPASKRSFKSERPLAATVGAM